MIRDITLAKAKARAIVSTHETSPPTPRPKYHEIALLPDGPGGVLQVTFGAHQATDRSDALDNIIRKYREIAQAELGDTWDATLADELAAYLPDLAKNTPKSCARLAADAAFHDLLRRAAADPLMMHAQEAVFERDYMRPAVTAVTGSGWVEPLSLAVVYDSMIHGSWKRIRDLVDPAPEREWVRRYVETRHWHLAHAGQRGSRFADRILRRTVYRMRTFEHLMAAGNWALTTPFLANGVMVHDSDLVAAA